MMRVSALGKRIGRLASSLGVLAVIAGTAAWGEAATLKRVHSGLTIVNDTTTATTVALDLPDATRAFVVCTAGTLSDDSNKRVTCELQDNQLAIQADVAPGAFTIGVEWQVAEFEDGVTVQRGTAAFASSATTANPVLTAVDCTKSFVLLSGERTTNGAGNLADDERFTFRALLGGGTACTSGTTTALGISRLESGDAASVAWQVVTMEGVSVERGTLCIGGAGTCPGSNGATTTATLATAVDTGKAIVLVSSRAGSAVNGVENHYLVRGDFTAAGASVTGLTFTRAASSTTVNRHVDIAWQVVTFTDGTVVQRPSAATAVAAGSGGPFAPVTAPVSSVDRTTSLLLLTTTGQAGDTSNARLAEYAVVGTFPSDTTVGFQRGDPARAATVSWFAVSFYRCQSSRLCSVDAAASDRQVVVGWSPIYDLACTSPTTCHALVLRDTSSVTAVPVNGTAYASGATVGTAVVVHDGSGGGVARTFTDTGLTNGVTYYYKVFPKTAPTTYLNLGNSVAEVRATPQGGTAAWSFAMTGGAMLTAPITNGGNGRLYVGGNGARVAVLDAATGEVVSEPVSTPGAIQGYLSWFPDATGGETVVAGDQSGNLTSVDALTGARQWTRTLAAENLQAPVSIQVRDTYWTSAAFRATYTGDVIYATTRNASRTVNRVIAVEAATGATLWTFTGAPAMDQVLGQPYVDYARDRLWITSRNGSAANQASVWVLDTVNDGTMLRSLALGDIQSAPTLSFDGGTVYVGGMDGRLHAIDAETMALRWTSSLSFGTAILGFVWEDFYLPGRLYYVTANGRVWCVDDVGATAALCPEWPVNPRRPVASGTVSVPLVGDLALWVGGSDGRLHELNLGTGAVDRTFLVESAATLGDVSTDDLSRLYVGSSSGRVYRIDLIGGSLP
jgi:hypothetical protein